jgi:hypothetical protein
MGLPQIAQMTSSGMADCYNSFGNEINYPFGMFDVGQSRQRTEAAITMRLPRSS